MPNWCNNTLTITATSNHRERIAQVRAEVAANGEPLQLECLNPHTPTEDDVRSDPRSAGLLALQGEQSDVTWYETNIARFGTKWEIDGVTEMVDETEVVYSFSTAWSPPEEAVAAFARRNPDLLITLEYDEPGMDFAGIITYEGGACVSHQQGNSRSVYCDICESSDIVEFDAPRICAGLVEARAQMARGKALVLEDIAHLANAGEVPSAIACTIVTTSLSESGYLKSEPTESDRRMHAEVVANIAQYQGAQVPPHVWLAAVDHRDPMIADAVCAFVPTAVIEAWSAGSPAERAAATRVLAARLSPSATAASR